MLICVVGYAAVIWGVGQVFTPDTAQGSLITRADGTVVGSRLIAQKFTEPRYFWPRPSRGGLQRRRRRRQQQVADERRPDRPREGDHRPIRRNRRQSASARTGGGVGRRSWTRTSPSTRRSTRRPAWPGARPAALRGREVISAHVLLARRLPDTGPPGERAGAQSRARPAGHARDERRRGRPDALLWDE